MRRPVRIGLLLSILLPCVAVLAAEQARAEDPELGDSRADRLNPVQVSDDGRTVRIGPITLDDASGTLRFPASVNMVEGAIELILCATKGKLHESVLVTMVDPVYLHAALLRLGLNKGLPVRYVGDPEPPTGDLMKIYAEWMDAEGQLVRRPVEDLVYSPRTGKTMEETKWVFAGSAHLDGRYMAQMEGSMITTYRDPFAIIDNASESGTDDDLFVANRILLPDVKTPVTVVIEKPRPEPATAP